MRILQINSCHYRRGGADVVYLNTIDLLETHGQEVINFSSEHPNNMVSKYSEFFLPFNEVRNQTFIQKIGNAKDYIFNKDAYIKLNVLIKKTNPDIAHIHLFYGSLTTSILKSLKENGIPVVISMHDYRLLCPSNAFLDSKSQICEKCKDKSYYKCFIKKCRDGRISYSAILSLEAYTRKYFYDPLDYIDHFLFVSKFSRAKHIEFDARFEKKSSHLYNFTPTFSSDISVCREGYLLFFGRLSIEKGIKTLIEAIKGTNIRIKLAGSGPMQVEVEDQCLKNTNIEYVGFKESDALTELIKNASFVVVPSEWYENNPMSIIEAYALGKPVIASNIGGIPEIVIDNKTGYLFEARNVEDLLNKLNKAVQLSDEEYYQMSLAARKFGDENFAPEPHYSKLIQIYSKVKDIKVDV
jgi:glycosyltransferase involved in cell wall biosynthesis